MEICRVDAQCQARWNQFVRQHYPPVGAFMQTWEWGAFQEELGRKVERYFMTDANATVAAFTFVSHQLPFNLSYAYIPRGPVITARTAGRAGTLDIFRSIQAWIREENRPGMIFVRMEPPLSSMPPDLSKYGFRAPLYYVQPRHNHTIVLDGTEQEIVARFHPSTRSNIRRAEQRGVTAELKRGIEETDVDTFFQMARQTIHRNSGKNVYPQRAYFDALTQAIPSVADDYDPARLSLGAFCAYEHGRPAATHFVLFFGDTATYLYGASFTDSLRSKAASYLHWAAMREAKRKGLKHYDLGGVDEARWPTLTRFKRQFRGKEFSYVGNIDIPARPALYRAYNIVRRFREFFIA
ncbi:MAG: peptidoglycan bridge formation glycyltransferase FemA/FemB family protein [Candidatus Sungbacteria bacterium]|nr:peptidoglycan bridge formation glycyltransferase FemA/FemB family protein [Candidatus Sungbacteria bacterium]